VSAPSHRDPTVGLGNRPQASVHDRKFGGQYAAPQTRPRDLTQTDHEYNAQVSSLRAPIERAIANLKAWRVPHTDYRRPLRTFLDTFHAVIGLHFFKFKDAFAQASWSASSTSRGLEKCVSQAARKASAPESCSTRNGHSEARRLASERIASITYERGEPMRRIGMIVAAAAAVLAPVAAPTGAAAAPASAAAYPTVNFLLKDGAGGYFAGTVTWYNRSVGVVGTFNADGCERVLARSIAGITGLDTRSTSLHCNTQTSENIPLSADVPGGADRVYIDIRDEYGTVINFTNCWLATRICN
jgi:hypothetical protein